MLDTHSRLHGAALGALGGVPHERVLDILPARDRHVVVVTAELRAEAVDVHRWVAEHKIDAVRVVGQGRAGDGVVND